MRYQKIQYETTNGFFFQTGVSFSRGPVRTRFIHTIKGTKIFILFYEVFFNDRLYKYKKNLIESKSVSLIGGSLIVGFCFTKKWN